MACACGCGGSPKGKTSRFLPGHDARMHTKTTKPAKAVKPKTSNYRNGYRPTKCKNCGEDIKGLYGSDRQAHKDGYCGRGYTY